MQKIIKSLKETFLNSEVEQSPIENIHSILLLLKTVPVQISYLHLQTESYSEHKAFGKYYNQITSFLDEFIEIYQGKNGRICITQNSPITLFNYGELGNDYIDFIHEILNVYLRKNLNEMDFDLKNLIDSIVGHTNRLRYLLTLE